MATGTAALGESLYAPLKIAAVISALAGSGVSAEDILEGTGLEPAQVPNPATRCSIQQLYQVGRNALRLSPQPGLGLRVGQRLHATSYGMWGYALLCCETLRHASDMAVRYHPLAMPAMGIRWFEAGDYAVWEFARNHEIPAELEPEIYRFFLDMQFSLQVTLVRDAMGSWCLPAKASYGIPAPDYAEQIAAILHCAVDFDQPRSQLFFPASWLERSLQMANPIAAVQMSATCARLMGEFRWQSGIARRVYDELTRVPGRFPGIDAVASSLCIAPRTLRRKLEVEGTSYTELLNRVRLALAIDFLRTTVLSVDDIATALGFSDAVSFRHALKRWTGKTPTDLRHGR